MPAMWLMSLVERIVDKGKALFGRKLSRCYKACFCGEDGKLTEDGERVLADLRTQAMLFDSAIRRDGAGAIDKDLLLKMEARRELVLRIINLLELDPLAVGKLVEVDHA